ncbi:Cyanovirin-N [Chaetomium sp. MPI-SDFR-AT-0129]|nr:Cyanovirin-N [Chaetomium sp. MPI-SDFR-AT-0129]
MAAAGGDFKRSCAPNYAIPNGQLMTAECFTGTGKTYRTILDLDHCMGNQGGFLVSKNDGAFSISCRECKRGKANGDDAWGMTMFNCYCENGKGGSFFLSEIDLNNFIENDHGYLSCFGHRGGLIGQW